MRNRGKPIVRTGEVYNSVLIEWIGKYCPAGRRVSTRDAPDVARARSDHRKLTKRDLE